MAHNWTEKDVAGQFEEAISTLKKLLPVKAQRYFNAWPYIVQTKKSGMVKPHAPAMNE